MEWESRRTTILFLVLILVEILLVQEAEGRKSSFAMTEQNKFEILTAPFGVGEDGAILSFQMDLTLVSINPDVSPQLKPRCYYVSLFGEEQFHILRQLYMLGPACSVDTYFRYEFCGSGNTASLSFERKIKKADWYYLIFSNCRLDVVTIAGHAEVVLSTGDYLSADELSLAKVYGYFTLFDGILLITMLACFISYYNRTGLTGMTVQKLTLLTIMFSTAAGIANVVYYTQTNKTGVDNSMQQNIRHVLRVGTDACLVAVTLMAALGHSILKSSFPVRAKQLFWGSFSVYMLLDFMYAFCSSPLSFCSAYMLSFFVIKFLVTFGVLVILNIHVDRLQSDLLDIPAHLHHVVFPKIRLYRSMRFAVMIYLALPVFFIIMNVTVVSWASQATLNAVLEESLVLFMCTYFFVLFFPSERTNSCIFQYVSPQNQLENYWDPEERERREEREENENEEQDALVGEEEEGEEMEERERERGEGERGESERGSEMGSEERSLRVEFEDIDLDKDIEEELEE